MRGLAFLATAALVAAAVPDWLITNLGIQPTFQQNKDGTFTLSNGLVSRTFTFSAPLGSGPGFGTVDMYSFTSETSLLRAIDVEGYVTLDNTTYALGTLIQNGTDFHGYLNRSATGLNYNGAGWDAVSYSLGNPVAPFPWTPGTRGSPKSAQWPPIGLQLAVQLRAPATAPASHKAVSIQLVYEMYPNIPLITKWMVINSTSSAAAGVVVTSTVPESLRLARQYTPCNLGSLASVGAGDWSAPPTQLYVQTDAAHNTLVSFLQDPASSSDWGAAECVLQTNYTLGPGVVLTGGGASVHPSRLHPTLLSSPPAGGLATAEFVSFRTFELVTDTYDPERTGLAVKRLTRLWAPHAQENPIFFHATAADVDGFHAEIDQMAATGFEMLIFSFGTTFILETDNPAYLAQIASLVAYAKSKGIEVGGYDLIDLDRGNGGYGGNVGDQWDTVLADGSLGPDACFASGWTDKITYYVNNFINATGLSMLETDGPYGGQDCHSTNHSHHEGHSDAMYQQTQQQAAFYSNLRSKNVYINQPDNYFFQGGQRTGLGYNEDQYSLPRWQDVTVSRMTVYDQTYAKIPTQGWMFVPLVDYHGGGDAAAFEPMSQHLPEYNMALAQYLLAGVAACYRGFRLYDTPEVQAVVTHWVSVYKQYREIITSDIVHVRRPDGQSMDAFMHVNAFAMDGTQAFAAVFNPTLFNLTQTLQFNLYYAGISTTALVSHEGSPAQPYTVARDYSIAITVTLPPQSVTWYAIASGDARQ